MSKHLTIALVGILLLLVSTTSGENRIQNHRTVESVPNSPPPVEERLAAPPIDKAAQLPVLKYDYDKSASPGMAIGYTTRDYQSNGRMTRQVEWRGISAVHFAWMKKVDFETGSSTMRVTSYQAWDTSFPAALYWSPVDFNGGDDLHPPGNRSGYAGIDVTPEGKALIYNHYDDDEGWDNYRTHLWFDFVPLAGFFGPYMHKLPDELDTCQTDGTGWDEFAWPDVEFQTYMGDTVTHIVAQQSPLDIGNDYYNPAYIHYYRFLGNEASGAWDFPCKPIDTVLHNWSHSVTASRSTGKVALVWTAGLPSSAGDNESVTRTRDKLNDVYYMTSDDMGATWWPKVNVTGYDSSKSGWRAHQDLSCLIDASNVLHIVWNAREYLPTPAPHGSFPHFYGSRLFHYDDMNTHITTVQDANWDLPDMSCHGGLWNDMSIVKPMISECNSKLYVVYVQFNDIDNNVWNDCADVNWTANNPNGTANGEIYLSISDDFGISWDPPHNLTNSRTPNCDTLTGGTECDSDHWVSMSRFGMYVADPGNFSGVPIVDPSGIYSDDYYLDVLFVNDKFPGLCIGGTNVFTNNPMNWFRLACINVEGNPRCTKNLRSIQYPAWAKHGVQRDTTLIIENNGHSSLHCNGGISVEQIYGPVGSIDISSTGMTISPGNKLEIDLMMNVGGVINNPGTVDSLVADVIITSDAPTSPDTVHVNMLILDTLYYAEELAHSIFEFSDTQGQDGWSYGYYLSPFTSSEFVEFTGFEAYDPGPYWYETENVPPWVSRTTMNSSDFDERACRRWESDYTGDIIITGEIKKYSFGTGGEVTGIIYIDGDSLWAYHLDDDDIAGTSFEIITDVTVGSTVDFVTDAEFDQSNDITEFYAVITEMPCNDLDVDGVCDAEDNCPGVSNPTQDDSDGDGIGDLCDNCPDDYNDTQADYDSDGIGDPCDNCPEIANAGQNNMDGDGFGDACDECPFDATNDADGDGICGIAVTNTLDTMAMAVPGTMRWAIEIANMSPEKDTIVFTISDTLQLLEPLQDITDDTMLILGSTAPGGAHSYVIKGLLPDKTFGSGIKIQSSGCLVEGLTIHGFTGAGIEVTGGARGNTFSNNLIYGNTGIGIDLNDDGVTTNDPGDGDSGPNELLNYPIVDSVYMLLDSSFVVYGSNDTICKVELFLAHPAEDTNRPAHVSGHGEAYEYIGSVETDPGGGFIDTISNAYPYFSQITMTATDLAGNTSEFSENFQLIPFPLIVTAYSPVNLWITDPEGGIIGKNADGDLTQDIFPASYDEEAPDYLDIVTIEEPLPGDYIIDVITETGAPPDATYSVGIRINGSLESMLIVDKEVPEASSTDSYDYSVEEGYHYLNGDVNDDGSFNLTDILNLIDCVYVNPGGSLCADPPEAGDANCDGMLNLTDILLLITYIYGDPPGPAPCEMSE